MEELHKQVMTALKSSKSKYVSEECLSSQLLKAAEASNPSLVGATSLERSLVVHWLAHLELHLCHCSSIQELCCRLVTADKALRKSDFLCGFSITIADTALFTFLKPFITSWSHQQKESLPNLSRWYQTIQSSNSVPKNKKNVPILFSRSTLYSDFSVTYST